MDVDGIFQIMMFPNMGLYMFLDRSGWPKLAGAMFATFLYMLQVVITSHWTFGKRSVAGPDLETIGAQIDVICKTMCCTHAAKAKRPAMVHAACQCVRVCVHVGSQPGCCTF